MYIDACMLNVSIYILNFVCTHTVILPSKKYLFQVSGYSLASVNVVLIKFHRQVATRKLLFTHSTGTLLPRSCANIYIANSISHKEVHVSQARCNSLRPHWPVGHQRTTDKYADKIDVVSGGRSLKWDICGDRILHKATATDGRRWNLLHYSQCSLCKHLYSQPTANLGDFTIKVIGTRYTISFWDHLFPVLSEFEPQGQLLSGSWLSASPRVTIAIAANHEC